MKILWIDPVNSDPQFINLVSIILNQHGNYITIYSNRRNLFDVPAGIDWVPFSIMKSFPTSLENRPLTKMGITALYPFDWFRACLYARRENIRSIIFSTNLALPNLDTFYLLFLRKLGIAPVVIVHKPYRNYFEDKENKQAYRYKKFYEAASLILVMTKYIKDQLRSLYDLPKDKFILFKHPHFQPLLDQYKTSAERLIELEQWHSGVPIITFLSRITNEHGFDNLLDCLPFLNDLLPKYKLLLIARLINKQDRIYFLEKLNKCGLMGSFKWHWDIYSFSDLKAYLQVTTVAILPYNYATQSACLTMASGMGIPVVATRVGGLPEMIQSGVNGELVTSHDPKSLAGVIAKVASNAESYGKKSRYFAEKEFSPINAAKIIENALVIAPSYLSRK